MSNIYAAKIFTTHSNITFKFKFFKKEIKPKINNYFCNFKLSNECLTLLDAISETDRWVWIVSSWSKHQSNSSRVSWPHCTTSAGNAVLWSGGRFGIGLGRFSSGGTFAIKIKLLRTMRKLANICANGVTIKSSPYLKIH